MERLRRALLASIFWRSDRRAPASVAGKVSFEVLVISPAKVHART